MKTKFYSLRNLLMGGLFLVVAASNFSCLKETDCTAVITVVYASTNQPVVGATVLLDCNTCQQTGNLQTDQQITDGAGKTNHVFRYPAVLDITVTSPAGSATGVIKLEEGETVDKEIKI